MKTNPVKIYFTLRSLLIWITPFTALHQQEKPNTLMRELTCYLLLPLNGNHSAVSSAQEMAVKCSRQRDERNKGSDNKMSEKAVKIDKGD